MQLSPISLALTRLGGVPFSPAKLFQAGEQGAWYDPSDLTTLYEDAAGTTPVTAVEQPVGLMLDKSGRGNHAFQTTSASRPTLSARVNLLTKTEQFNDAVWTKTGLLAFGSGSTANAATAPDGTVTADLITQSSVNDYHIVGQNQTVTAGSLVTASCYLKKPTSNAAQYVGLQITDAVAKNYVILINLNDGTRVNWTGQAGYAAPISSSVVDAGNGWWRATVTAQLDAARTTAGPGVLFSVDGNPATNGQFTGNGTSGVLVWGADLRVANDGVGLPVYQRVNTSTDYDTSGFPIFLRFDGTDDSMLTNSVDFTATDKMTVWAGVRKLSDAAAGMVAELSAVANSNDGSFAIAAPGWSPVASRYGSLIRGTTNFAFANTPANFTAPITNVLTENINLGVVTQSSQLAMRVNGLDQTLSFDPSTTSTGNFGNYPLYIGRRNNATMPFNGRAYSLIIRGAASTAAQIASTESWVNGKTKAYA